MIFSLEALEARQGDCLLLYFGDPNQPSLCLIDGGPATVYDTSLRPRLEELRQQMAPGEALALDAVIVSHIDDDHIHGILDLSNQMIECADDQQPQPYTVRALWHNAFEDLIGDPAPAPTVAAARIASGGGGGADWDDARHAAAVVASVGQGRALRDNARRLGWPINPPTHGLVTAGTACQLAGAAITIVAPGQTAIDNLQHEWATTAVAKQNQGTAQLAAYLDTTVPNLSSIVCLVEYEGKNMLLTGDARGDAILAGLNAAGKLTGGKLQLDLLKLPHHGSDRNVTEEFFAKLPAQHYVISGNGKYGNPEVCTLEMISKARQGEDDFTIHLTYADGEENLGQKLADFALTEQAAGRTYTTEAPLPPSRSVRVDLLDEPSQPHA